MSNKRITIAIDGHSSCGKSTMAKALSRELGYVFVDSGAMYRGVTLYCMQHGFIVDGEPDELAILANLDNINLSFEFNPVRGASDLLLNGENVEALIRMPEVAGNVSKIAALPFVRKKLVDEQRKMGENGGIVMDGRDIGSIVFPEAELKLFVTAQPEIRAERRLLELQQNHIETTFEEVLHNLTERDYLDSNREDSPLIQTPDAIVIDTSDLNREEQLHIALELVKSRLK
ncbi:MAG: (d)CMP kinase [Cryomorphaceae bacterium]|jgi:cytidylate kinase|nr:(d)CMP kinase [Cryomorphaceae bacterium]